MPMTLLTTGDSCGSDDAEHILDMVDAAERIDHDDFLEAIGNTAYDELERSLGYGVNLRLAEDWHVSFWKSTFKGIEVIYLDHSLGEYIFAEN